MYRKLLYTKYMYKNILENRQEHVLIHVVQWLKSGTLININETWLLVYCHYNKLTL